MSQLSDERFEVRPYVADGQERTKAGDANEKRDQRLGAGPFSILRLFPNDDQYIS